MKSICNKYFLLFWKLQKLQIYITNTSLWGTHRIRNKHTDWMEMGQFVAVSCSLMRNGGKVAHFVLWPAAISHPVVTTYPPDSWQFMLLLGGGAILRVAVGCRTWFLSLQKKMYPKTQECQSICSPSANVMPAINLLYFAHFLVKVFIILCSWTNERFLLVTDCERFPWEVLAQAGLRGLLNDGLSPTFASCLWLQYKRRGYSERTKSTTFSEKYLVFYHIGFRIEYWGSGVINIIEVFIRQILNLTAVHTSKK